MKIIATAAIIFLSTSVASKTLYQAKIWVAQNNTQIRVKSEIYPSKCSHCDTRGVADFGRYFCKMRKDPRRC